MDTIIKTIDQLDSPSSDEIFSIAAKIIQSGGLVAFPTETVYGLGANAFDKDAVSHIYKAKGRPSDNPLIVHISNVNQLESIANNITNTAKNIIEAFWPGPLTIVFEKKEIIPNETSGGLATVAVRLPANRIARELIEKSGVPIAAPSANVSGRPSPTKASHVIFDLNGKVDMIIDGGHSVFGIESTVLDCTSEPPTILRPGTITKEMLEKVCGKVNFDPSIFQKPTESLKPKAPGQKYKHYSPEADVTIFKGETKNVVKKIISESTKYLTTDVGIMCSNQSKDYYANINCVLLSLGDKNDLNELSSNLFSTLRTFDYLGVKQILSEDFGDNIIGNALMNRLEKAAGYNIVIV